MKLKKTLMTGGVVTAVGMASVLGMGLVSAQSSPSGTGNLVDKIAQKFNLNKTDVQAVFDEDKAAHAAQRQADEKARLDQAVKDGKITQEQEDKIIAKQAELKKQMETERDAMKNKTEAERKAAMDQRRTELEQWAKDNNVPIEYLRPGGRGHGHGHDGVGVRM